MKATIVEAMGHIGRHHSPKKNDQLLIAPADLPRITVQIIDSVASAVSDDRIVVPCFGGKRGHPIRIPWGVANGIHDLSADQGIDALVAAAGSPCRIEFDPELRPRDIDTPEDYQREHRKSREVRQS